MWLQGALQPYSRSLSQDMLAMQEQVCPFPKQEQQAGPGSCGLLNLELNTQPKAIPGTPRCHGADGEHRTRGDVQCCTQAEGVKNILLFILLFSSCSNPAVDGRSCWGSLTATTMTFFASFFFSGSAETVTTHPAPKGTCWKATGLAGTNKKAFNAVFFLV